MPRIVVLRICIIIKTLQKLAALGFQYWVFLGTFVQKILVCHFVYEHVIQYLICMCRLLTVITSMLILNIQINNLCK